MSTMRARLGFTLIEVLIAVMVLAFTLGAALESNSSVVRTQLELDLRYQAHRVLTDIMITCYLKKSKLVSQSLDLDCPEEGESAYRDSFIYWQRSWQELETIKDFEAYPFLVQTIAAYVDGDEDRHRIGLIHSHYVGSEEEELVLP